MVTGAPLSSAGGVGGEEEEMGGKGKEVDCLCINGRRCGRRPLV